LEEVECCWDERVPPGTGVYGRDFEIYCSTCENGGTRGMINCSDPELQYSPVSSQLWALLYGGEDHMVRFGKVMPSQQDRHKEGEPVLTEGNISP
jgi:hypothetical protein